MRAGVPFRFLAKALIEDIIKDALGVDAVRFTRFERGSFQTALSFAFGAVVVETAAMGFVSHLHREEELLLDLVAGHFFVGEALHGCCFRFGLGIHFPICRPLR